MGWQDLFAVCELRTREKQLLTAACCFPAFHNFQLAGIFGAELLHVIVDLAIYNFAVYLRRLQLGMTKYFGDRFHRHAVGEGDGGSKRWRAM